MDIAGSMNITYKADISAHVETRPSVLYWVIQPGSNVGGIGAGLVRMVRPWNEWLIVWGYDISQPPPEVDTDKAIEIARNLLGMPDLDIEITGTGLWGNNEMYATHLQKQRVFAAGDAVHRHPPSNGLGSNTSIQDSYNLAWKLAAVLKNQAGPELLETYSTERAPVAEQIVKRANKSSREFGQFFEVLGLMEAEHLEEEMRQQIEEPRPTPRAAAPSAKPWSPRWNSRTTSSMPTGSTLDSSMSQPRSFRMDLKGLNQRGTLSFTTKPPPSPARTCRTCGSATPRTRSPPSTGRGSARSTRTACSWSAPTSTSAGARSPSHATRNKPSAKP